MSKILVSLVSLLCVVVGWVTRDRPALVMGVTSSGVVLRPISSGSESGTLISLGLMSFVMTFVFSIASFWLKGSARKLRAVYFVNLMAFSFMVFLVSLDASIVEAATFGDKGPLLSIVLAFVPAGFFLVSYLRNAVGKT